MVLERFPLTEVSPGGVAGTDLGSRSWGRSVQALRGWIKPWRAGLASIIWHRAGVDVEKPGGLGLPSLPFSSAKADRFAGKERASPF